MQHSVPEERKHQAPADGDKSQSKQVAQRNSQADDRGGVHSRDDACALKPRDDNDLDVIVLGAGVVGINIAYWNPHHDESVCVNDQRHTGHGTLGWTLGAGSGYPPG